MKTNKLLIIIICCNMILTLIGCSTQNTNVKQEEKLITVVHADYPYYPSIDALAERATTVIEGTIVDSRVEEIDDRTKVDLGVEGEIDDRMNPSKDTPPSIRVYTVYTVKVSNTYKGDVKPGETIEVKQIGGESKTMVYKVENEEDNVKFVEGKKYVMFLSTYENSPATLLNPIQACYSYEEDTVKTKSTVENEQLISVNEKNDLTLTIEDLERIKNETKK
ncbi:hypothetical protein SAMN05446037_10235 [Anaerovirgula multivorans]|uniref:Lipoprotein n=1 Tax=Anaerovirgula multivorans TaxID=312168 RepID=A0A239HNV7_9FIRM|nr:hypothetical protein [Anaerovirgula multivorans]SNS83000.1 hypothetical protein SAMN05446037_10235 [Anaerovirgula multivorans]